MCHALTYLHESRIVHRNIKPRNILVLKTGAVKIWNFNLAYFEDKGEQPGAQAELQAEGVVPIVGTALYMSPEQVSGVLPPDGRCDIFATGIVLYELLAGSHPFEGKNLADTIFRIVRAAPAPFVDSLEGQAGRPQEITFRALAKDGQQRYQTAEELALELDEVRERIITRR